MEYFTRVFILAYGVLFCSASFEDRLLDLESIVKVQHEENEIMRTRIVAIEAEISDLIVADNRLKQKVESENQFTVEHDYKNMLNDEEDDLPAIQDLVYRRASSNNVAFHAYRSTNRCYHTRETIVFDAESLDVGGVSDVGVYDKRDGIFEPPVTGVYVFTWTITAQKGGHSFLTELVISGNVSGVITSDPDEGFSTDGGPTPPPQRRRTIVGSGIHPATAVVVAQVDAGAHCFIRVRQTAGVCTNVLSDSNFVLTTFSAWRLF